jgi:hypothetical protein
VRAKRRWKINDLFRTIVSHYVCSTGINHIHKPIRREQEKLKVSVRQPSSVLKSMYQSKSIQRCICNDGTPVESLHESFVAVFCHVHVSVIEEFVVVFEDAHNLVRHCPSLSYPHITCHQYEVSFEGSTEHFYQRRWPSATDQIQRRRAGRSLRQ